MGMTPRIVTIDKIPNWRLMMDNIKDSSELKHFFII